MSQRFVYNVLDLAKQERFYPYECISDCEKFKEQLRSKESFYCSLTVKSLFKLTSRKLECSAENDKSRTQTHSRSWLVLIPGKR